ncbi:MAG: NAD(P)/FAD-dependent oxidoreductase [Gammaproteobacteria bacterium]|nr:NAD(P)/FAD-dependent oxidoreductase [Gammaproteobacteria bacterium]
MNSAAAYDCVLIGGGHNGLVCAHYLARAGRSVLVLEAAPELGGAAATREFAPGFSVSACAHLLHLMPPELMRDLQLERHGLRFAASDMATLALDAGGAALRIGPESLTELGSGAVAADSAAYRDWSAQLRRFAGALHPVLTQSPPRLGSAAWRDRAALLGLGLRLRRLGRADMRELLRVGGMCVHDVLEERFASPLLKGALALDAVLGTNYGPRSPGTMLSLLYRHAASGGAERLAQPLGGMGSLTRALAAAARAAGATLRTGTAVERILVHEDQVQGVVLSGGEEVRARAVISSADPKTTFLRLLGAEHLDAGFTRRVTQLRTRGLAAKLHLALDGMPDFRGVPAPALAARLVLAPSADHIERAYNHAKYRECSAVPVMEVTLPSLADPALAPAGGHVLSAIVQYAPYEVAGGWEAQRPRLLDAALRTLAQHAPDLPQRVRAAELLTPPDIEREFRIGGGHWHHAELALDQFFLVRPVPGAAQYRAPVAGLYLCGAGSHPGGGVMGLAGRNAARAVLREAA